MKEEKNSIEEHPLKTIGRFSSTNSAGQKGGAQYIQAAERKKRNSNQEYSSLAKQSLKIEGQVKPFLDKQKLMSSSPLKFPLKQY